MATPTLPPQQALVRIAGPAASLRKAQREFNRASERLAALQQHLAVWQAAADACHQRAAQDLRPVQARLAALQRSTLLWIDAYLQQPTAGEKLPKKHRAKLVAMLRLLAGVLLQAGQDDEVEAAHDRHSQRSHREQQQAQTALAAGALGRAMGDPSLFDGATGSVEDMLQQAGERLRARQVDSGDRADTQAAPPPGQRPSPADKARARDAQALQAAGQSVREVYRRLASSLHPDREADPAERDRKTALMSRVNAAYDRQDLLALLQLQLQATQVDAAHLGAVPDERLRQYTRVLKDQQQVLLHALERLQMPVADLLQQAPGGLAWAPRMLQDALADDIAQTRAALAHLQQDSQALRDARTRPAMLRALQVDDPDDAPDAFEELLLMEMLHDMAAAQAPLRGRGRRRR